MYRSICVRLCVPVQYRDPKQPRVQLFLSAALRGGLIGCSAFLSGRLTACISCTYQTSQHSAGYLILSNREGIPLVTIRTGA
ncbi:hypothetical protein FA95DRAFT_1555254 [Auriscalpium vulgare]|uniref:Uncharacterized protein n=1 Tax=Auriscalpium vulgare TaxID=40419 RepID=A0ACB8S2R7_9AGAM|nr:hypothetical protein FA95DRAFT_1555254 [Auriscalpium vulgare]